MFLNIMKQTGFEVTKFHLGVSALESEPTIGHMVDSKNMKMDKDGKLIGVDWGLLFSKEIMDEKGGTWGFAPNGTSSLGTGSSIR